MTTFGRRISNGYSALLQSGVPIAPGRDPRRIVCWGDSLTYGTGATHDVDDYPTQLAGISGRSVSNQGVPGESSTQIAARVAADTSMRDRIAIFWAGTNDGTNPALMLAAAAAVNALYDRVIFAGALNRPTEYDLGDPLDAHTIAHDAVIAAGLQMETLYPGRYIDLRALLVAFADHEDATDALDFRMDVPPTSLRYDTVHLLPAGYRIIAHAINWRIFTLGW